MNVRPAVPSDAPALKALDTVVPLEPERAEHIDGWLQREEVLVAEISGQVVGYGVFNHSFFRQGTIEMLMVHPAHRGKGVGHLLLTSLEESCNTAKLWVTTNRSNHQMQRLLNRRGFQACGYIDGLDPDDPEIVYSKPMGGAEKGAR